MGAKKKPSAGTPAFAALLHAGVDFTPHQYEHDPRAESYGAEAAARIGVEAARVFKTLMVDLDDELCVGVVPVTGSLDLNSLAKALGGRRAQMADAAHAQRATGYVLGGISPFGQRTRHRTVVDSSAQHWPTVFVSAGRRGLEAEVAPTDLVLVTGAVVARIAR